MKEESAIAIITHWSLLWCVWKFGRVMRVDSKDRWGGGGGVRREGKEMVTPSPCLDILKTKGDE
jgi:hypothetical protein